MSAEASGLPKARSKDDGVGMSHILGIGSALAFCGFVAWVLTDKGIFQAAMQGSRGPRGGVRPRGAQPGQEAESYEDALHNLEANQKGGAKASASTRRAAEASKVKVSGSPISGGRPSQAAQGNVAPTQKPQERTAAKEIVDELFERLQEEGADGAQRGGKGRQAAQRAEPEPVEDDSHLEFAKHLKAEQEQKLDYTITDVRKDFKRDYGADASGLLCSGCRIVAARLEHELDTHDVHEQDTPAAMILAKRRALDAACSSFRHVDIVDTADHGLRYQAIEESEDSSRPEHRGQRMCRAILEEARFDSLAHMIQQKAAPRDGKHNWERWLCADRMRLCKRSQVRDDDEEGEL